MVRSMVKCESCINCIPFKSDVSNEKYYGCDKEWKKITKRDDPEYWLVFEHPEISEKKIMKVNPFSERECPEFEQRPKTDQ